MAIIHEVVRSELQTYADRGIFQNFSSSDLGGKFSEFKFHWLTEKPFLLKLNVAKYELELKSVLPAVPFRSDMDKAFRSFLVERCSEGVPDHRKIDAKRFSIKAKNTNSKLSVSIGFLRDDAHLAVKASVNLLHEIFNNFLVEGPYQNYMVEAFNLPEE